MTTGEIEVEQLLKEVQRLRKENAELRAKLNHALESINAVADMDLQFRELELKRAQHHLNCSREFNKETHEFVSSMIVEE